MIPEIGDQCIFIKNRQILEKDSKNANRYILSNSVSENSISENSASDVLQPDRFSLEKTINDSSTISKINVLENSINENFIDSSLLDFHLESDREEIVVMNATIASLEESLQLSSKIIYLPLTL